MNNMLGTIVPKSDQLNADDLIGGQTLTIKVSKVSILAGDQPVAIHYEGDNGKPYKPGKSMRRVLVNCWGSDANLYVGRSMTLFRDEKVLFGGVAVGGLRISHLSHISEPITLALTASKANRKPFTVKPLIETPVQTLAEAIHDMIQAKTDTDLATRFSTAVRAFKSDDDRQKIIAAKDARKKELTTGVTA